MGFPFLLSFLSVLLRSSLNNFAKMKRDIKLKQQLPRKLVHVKFIPLYIFSLTVSIFVTLPF